MATAVATSGAAPNPRKTRGLVPPAPDNVVAWFEFFLDVPTRNLRDVGAPAAAVGAPQFPGDFARLSGSAADYIDTGIVPAQSFGILALARSVATPPSGGARVFSNYTSASAGEPNQTYMSVSGEYAVLDFVAGYADSAHNVQVGVPEFSQWHLLYGGCTNGVEQRSMNLTDNLANVVARTVARKADTASLRLGTDRTGGGTRGLDIAALAICNGRQPSPAEIIANAKRMQARAAAIGITVALTMTA